MTLLEFAAGLDHIDDRAVILFDPATGEIGPATEVVLVVPPPEVDLDDPKAAEKLGRPGQRVLLEVSFARKVIKVWMDWGDGVPPPPEKAVEVILNGGRLAGGLHPGRPSSEEVIERARKVGGTALDLRNRRLTSLPESIWGLSGLETLNLSDNVLEELPDAIGALSRLRKLNLKNNRLWQLPAAIGRLTNLLALDVSGNALEGLPDSIGGLTSLKILHLARNQIRELPPSLFKNETLMLQLNGNPICPPQVVNDLQMVLLRDLESLLGEPGPFTE